MSNLITYAELQEIVSDLRAMAAVEPAQEVREALHKLADRYAALSSRGQTVTPRALPLH
jgi:acyl carrier protein phosphodiesterase